MSRRGKIKEVFGASLIIVSCVLFLILILSMAFGYVPGFLHPAFAKAEVWLSKPISELKIVHALYIFLIIVLLRK